jgi:hypothetical protein
VWRGEVRLPGNDKLGCKHRQALAKHARPQLVSGGKGQQGAQGPHRLRRLLITLIKEFIAPSNPARTTALMEAIYPAGDPDDSIDDIGVDED